MQWDRLLDEARADAHAEGRVRERWLRRQATEEATLVGTLVDLAEGGAAVAFGLDGGRRHEGRIVGIGHDVIVLLDRTDHVAIRLAAITVVRPHPGGASGPAAGARAAALDLTLIELLARIVDEKPDVAITLGTGEVLSGSLLAVGADVLTVRVAPGADGVAYCSAAAVSSVRLRSG